MVSRSRALAPLPRDTRLVALTELLKASKAPGPEELDQALNALRTRLSAERARQRRFVLWSRAALATLCVLAAMGALLVLHQRASTPQRVLALERIEGGRLLLVTVKGTEFTVLWEAASEQFELRLKRGSVSVRGPVLRDELALRPGQKLRVSLPRAEVVISEGAADQPASPAGALASAPDPEQMASSARAVASSQPSPPLRSSAAPDQGPSLANAAQTREDSQRLAEEYLRRFPEGSYAGTARALLRVP
jgi:hypothetical protein